MDREPDRAGLIGDRPCDCLADPPVRVRRELVAARVVELLDRAYQPDVPLLDEVEQAECRSAARDISSSDADDKAQVGRDEPLTGRLPETDEVAGGLHARCFGRPSRVAHLSQQGVVPTGLDPAPEGGDGELLARPRLKRTNDGAAPVVLFGDLSSAAAQAKD